MEASQSFADKMQAAVTALLNSSSGEETLHSLEIMSAENWCGKLLHRVARSEADP